jgi:hypothetical protein
MLRAGAAALLAAGLLIGTATLLRGPFVDPRTDAAAFAAWVTGARYVPAALLFVCGLLAQMFGVTTLYLFLARGRGPRLVFTGTLLTLLTDTLLLLMMGVFCFVFPTVGRMYREGHTEVIGVATAFGPPFLALLGLQALTFTGGTVTTAVAIARCGLVPRWCGWAYAIGGIVLAFAPPIPYDGEFPGAVLMAAAYARIALGIWRGSHPEAVSGLRGGRRLA